MRVTLLLLGLVLQVVASAGVVSLSNAEWTLKVDEASGALVEIRNARDPESFNFIREAGKWERRVWVADHSEGAITQGGQWGLVETNQTGLLHSARVKQISPTVVEAEYGSSYLTVVVRRELSAEGLTETYTFKNTGMLDLDLPMGSVAISAPLFDQYPDAQRSLAARCHAHLWMGGSSAWINATRMGANPPHLGLVMTEGALDDYSQRGATLSDRGWFLLHPAAMKIPGGQSRSFSWKLFWHTGWDDFFAKAGKLSEHFVRLTAQRYTVVAGESVDVSIRGRAPGSAHFLVNGMPTQVQAMGGSGVLSFPTTPGKYGEMRIEMLYGVNRELKTWLVANVVREPLDLIRTRLEFIIRNQQRRAPVDPLDGAYLAYDNETGKQVYAYKPWDHNAGRERVGMGILGAMYLPMCKDAAFKAELADSLKRYADFITRELEDEQGNVSSNLGHENIERLYNFPWVARFHLAMYKATGEADHLDRFVRVCRQYYAHGGAAFYPIGMPVLEGLEILKQAGPARAADYAEVLKGFRANGDAIVKTGGNYPQSEVNYEQSIVAPAVQFLLELYRATGDRTYLDGTKAQLPLAEAFNGRQPDHHLYEVGIRHWDDYWFGKLKLYGDTFPHYWSCITGLMYAHYAKSIGGAEAADWMARAEAAITGNLSLFTPDGRGSAAHVYPYSTNGVRAEVNDPWANDQDWALVHWLLLKEQSAGR